MIINWCPVYTHTHTCICISTHTVYTLNYYTDIHNLTFSVFVYALSQGCICILAQNAGASKFRVHMKESENLSDSGPVDLVVSEDGITLLSIQTGKKFNQCSLKFLGGGGWRQKGDKFIIFKVSWPPSKFIVKSE